MHSALALLPAYADPQGVTHASAALLHTAHSLVNEYPPLGAVAGAGAILLPAGLILLFITVVEAVRERLRKRSKGPPR